MTFHFILLLLFHLVVGQDSVKVVHDKGSCSVINFNCGGGQTPTDGQTVEHNQGVPGKRGPAGGVGPKGEKGSKGSQGIQGDAGKDADLDRVRKNVAQSMGVQNCQEVKDILGSETTGYYLMRDPSNKNAIFVMCDFQIRPGISTCKQLEERDHVRESGFYWIRPVGSNEAFQVYCNFTDKQVSTEIWHDLMRETKLENCESNGCYSAIPEYNIKQEHILKVINASRECKQYIKLRCHGVVIVLNSNKPFAWWVSRSGEKMLYWGGATSRRSDYCSCGETGSCYNNKYKCNCDNNGNVMTSDDGYLTDSTKLPVREMRFGDAGDSSEHGWHTLGPLECKG